MRVESTGCFNTNLFGLFNWKKKNANDSWGSSSSLQFERETGIECVNSPVEGGGGASLKKNTTKTFFYFLNPVMLVYASLYDRHHKMSYNIKKQPATHFLTHVVWPGRLLYLVTFFFFFSLSSHGSFCARKKNKYPELCVSWYHNFSSPPPLF